jgi:dinuclear metal center YbgI/SA1388 family protein
MAVNFSWLRAALERYAPERFKEGRDNVGLLVGETQRQYSRILTALDVTDPVIDEALALGADLLLTHHPVIYKPVPCITDETALGRRLLRLIRRGVAVFSAHTNLDAAVGGTNDVLFDLLGLIRRENLLEGDGCGMGRAGELPARQTLAQFAALVRDRLRLPRLQFAGDPCRAISRVALCTGQGAETRFFHGALAKGCDVYVTGDITYHDAQAAADLGLALIDGTHYATEALALPRLAEFLRGEAAASGLALEVDVAARGRDIFETV